MILSSAMPRKNASQFLGLRRTWCSRAEISASVPSMSKMTISPAIAVVRLLPVALPMLGRGEVHWRLDGRRPHLVLRPDVPDQVINAEREGQQRRYAQQRNFERLKGQAEDQPEQRRQREPTTGEGLAMIAAPAQLLAAFLGIDGGRHSS